MIELFSFFFHLLSRKYFFFFLLRCNYFFEIIHYNLSCCTLLIDPLIVVKWTLSILERRYCECTLFILRLHFSRVYSHTKNKKTEVFLHVSFRLTRNFLFLHINFIYHTHRSSPPLSSPIFAERFVLGLEHRNAAGVSKTW